MKFRRCAARLVSPCPLHLWLPRGLLQIILISWSLISLLGQSLPTAWSYSSPVGTDLSTPSIGPDGTVYVGIGDRGVTQRGWVAALRPNGTLRWRVEVLSAPAGTPSQSVVSMPVVDSDGSVLVAAVNTFAAEEGSLLRLDNQGAVQWRFASAGAPISHAAVAANGTIYFPTAKNVLHALKPDGTEKWQLTMPHGLYSAPSIGTDGTIYVGGLGLYAIAPEGAIRWFFGYDGAASTPAIAIDGSIYFTSADGYLIVVNPDGSLRWKFPLGGGLPASPIIAPDGTAYVGAAFGLHAINRSGIERWSFASPGAAGPPTVADNGTIYFSAAGTGLYALTAEGTLQGTSIKAGTGAVAPSITASGNILFIRETRIEAVQGVSLPATVGWPSLAHDGARTGRSSPSANPGRPLNLRASAGPGTNSGMAQLSWDVVGGLPTYEVWRSGSRQVTNAARLAANWVETRFADELTMAGIEYTYWVRAVTPAGVGEWSSPASISIPDAKPGEILWHFPDTSLYPGSVAVGQDGRFVIGNTAGQLFCFAADGAKLWEFQADRAITSSPTIGPDGAIYFGTSEYFLIGELPRVRERGGSFYALNPDGSVRWKFEGAGVRSTATLGPDGTVYFGTLDDRFVALNPNGNVKWENAEGDGAAGGSICSAAALDRGEEIFFGNLTALTTNGTTLWRNPFGTESSSSPILGSDGTIYVGNDSPPIFLSNTSFTAFNRDGSIRWQFPVISTRSSPTLAEDGTIYFGSDDANLYALRPDGTKKWQFATEGLVGSSPAVDSAGTVYFGSHDGRLYSVNPDGTERMRWALGTAIRSSPAIGPEGRIYIAADQGGIYVIKGERPLAQSPWPMIHHDPAHTSQTTIVPPAPTVPRDLNATQGTVFGGVRLTWTSVPWANSYDLWRGTNQDLARAVVLATNVTRQLQFDDRSALSGQRYFYWIRAQNLAGASGVSPATLGFHETVTTILNLGGGSIEAPPAIGKDGSFYVSLNRGGSAATGRLVCLQASGLKRWEYAVPNTFRLTGAAVGSDGTIYFGADNKKFYALTTDGAKKWEFATAEPLLTAPAINGDGLIIFNGWAGAAYALDPAGELVWRQPWNTADIGEVVVGTAGKIYLKNGQRLLVKSPNGATLWSTSLSENTLPAIALADDGTVYYGRNNFLTAVTPNGTNLWETPMAGHLATTPVVAPDGTVYVVTDQGSLYAIQSDGAVKKVVAPGATPAISAPGLTLARDGSLFFTAAGRLVIINPNLELNSILSMPQASSPPVIAPDGNVYVGTADGKLFVLHSTYQITDRGWPMLRHDLQQTANLSKPSPSPSGALDLSASLGVWAGMIRLTWHEPPTFAFYEIRRGLDGNITNSVLATNGLIGQAMLDDTNVQPGVSYSYWIRAFNNAGTNDWQGPVVGQATPGVSLLWSWKATNFPSNPSIGTNHTLYVAEGGVLHALDTATSIEKWIYNGVADAPMVLSNGWLIARTASPAGLLALDEQGALKWNLDGQPDVTGYPAAGADDTIYWADGSALKAISADGALQWTVDVQGRIYTSPSIAPDGTIYCATDQTIFAVNPNGTSKWEFATGASLGPSLAVDSDGTLYAGLYDTSFVAIDALGVVRWRPSVGYGHTGHPILARRGLILAPLNNSALQALGYDGLPLWNVRVPTVGPAVAKDGTIFIDGGTNLVTLNPDGSNRWRFNLGARSAPAAKVSFPMLTEAGTVYFTAGKQLFALQTPNPAGPGWTMFRANPRRTARAALNSGPVRIYSAALSKGTLALQIRYSSLIGAQTYLEASADLIHWTRADAPISRATGSVVEAEVPLGTGVLFFRVMAE